MLPSFATQKVQIERPALVPDGHGNVTPDWAASTTFEIGGCSVQPGDATEDLTNRDGRRIDFTVFFPAEADVKRHDRVWHGGAAYLIDGAPLHWSTGVLDHVVARIYEWEG